MSSQRIELFLRRIMPSTKPIIFLKGEFRDDIKSFGFDEKTRQYYVQFQKGENYLHYNPSNVDVAEFVRQMDPPLRVIRKRDGFVFSKTMGVRVFEGKEHRGYRVVFESGATKDYDADYLGNDDFFKKNYDDKAESPLWSKNKNRRFYEN